MTTQKSNHPKLRSRPHWQGLFVLGLFLLLIGTIGNALAETAVPANDLSSQQTTAAYQVFVPLVINGGTSTTPPPPPPPPPPSSGGIFLDRTVKTASASTAIDAAGGYHTAFVHYVADVEGTPAVYGYCATDCAKAANWRYAQLLDKTREVQLALTATGQPRLLIVTSSAVYSGGKDYHYATCDANCTESGKWTAVRVLSSWGTDSFDVNNDRTPQRSFALDNQGRPRFFYQDRNYFYREPDHYGAFYVYCDANCTNAANWKETEVGRFINYDAEVFDLPSLAFTSTGQPRVISRVFAKNADGSEAPTGLYYYECNSGCDQTANWKRVFLIPTGTGALPHPSWDIELDANNRPRVVIFTGTDLSPDTFENRLLYLWCNSSCLNADSWNFNSVGLAREVGESPDLALDAQGKPRIAWIDIAGDAGYSWCNTACESDAPQWQSKTVETEAALRQNFPQAIPSGCDSDVWEGLAPVLSLDKNGNPRIAYDVSVEARCLYDDPNDGQPPYYKFIPVWRAARLTYFNQP